MVSVIVPVHNEREKFLRSFLEQLHQTIKIAEYEVILVNDGSKHTIPDGYPNTRIINHESNKGVGAAFDTGVAAAKYDNIIMSACDIRFLDNSWAIKLLQAIEKEPKALVCSTMVGLNQMDEARGSMDMEARQHTNRYCGATMLIFHGKHNNKNKPKTFRSIIDAKWLYEKNHPEGEELTEIPCILGAVYAIKKGWYNHIDGFHGHIHWGTLEPLISIKSWLFGGKCLLHREAVTGHIFKIAGTHGTPQRSIAHNKLWTSYVLFNVEDRRKLWNWLPDRADYREARNRFDFVHAEHKRKEYLDKTVIDIHDYFNSFNIEFDDKTSQNNDTDKTVNDQADKTATEKMKEIQ